MTDSTALREMLAEQLFHLYAEPFGIDTWEGQPTTWETLQESLREEFRRNADALLSSDVLQEVGAEAVREVARLIYNGAGDPEQQFYDHGVNPWLQRQAMFIERQGQPVGSDPYRNRRM